MSYTPPDQLLDEPLTQAIEALKNVCAVMDRRLLNSTTHEADTWTDEHINELEDCIREITALRQKLIRLRADTT